MEFEYAIKKIVKRNGKIIYVPMVRKVTKIRKFNFNEWFRIIKVYSLFIKSSDYLEDDFGLTHFDCLNHIEGYKIKVESERSEEVVEIDLALI